MNMLTSENFDESIKDKICLVKFTAEWCGPCKSVAPALSKVSTETGVVVYEVDSDSETKLSERFGIRGLPTILGFKDGKPVDQVVGAVAEAKILELVAKLK